MCNKKEVSIISTSPSEQFDSKLATKHTGWLFQSLGLWTIITEYFTFREKFLSMFAHVMCEFLMLIVIVPSFYYLFWTDEELKIKLAVFGPIGVTITCALKYYSVIYNRKNIRYCLKQIKRDWEKIENIKDRAIMIQNVNKGNNVTIIFAVFMFTGGISHQAAAPFLPGSLLSILKNSSERPLVFPVTIISSMFNTQRTPIYEIIYFLHILMGAVVCTMSVGTCNLGAILVTHVCGQIQIIISRLEKFVDRRSLQNSSLHKKKIAKIVDLHNNVIKFSSKIQNIMGEICLIEIVGATVIICVDEYYCLMFSRVGESIYMSNWEYLKPSNARDFIFMIIMAQNPIKLTANGLMELSCNGFSKNMEKIFQQISLVELIAVTLVVCASEHSYLKFWERREMVNLITYLVTIIGLSSNFLIFCWISEILKEQLFRVGLLSYESSWYELPCKTSSTFILIIAMAQRPQVLTAGGLIELSFVTFVNYKINLIK
ncbi:uncharacterized protein [Chelonus insularis]|uniref:uncharacterized protein n=1 Tax=Chelonus insularis TaxID=460826 RepID=UPI00158DC4C5|nr:uncharacterized protein LOC118070201 [Chelonus insularis]